MRHTDPRDCHVKVRFSTQYAIPSIRIRATAKPNQKNTLACQNTRDGLSACFHNHQKNNRTKP